MKFNKFILIFLIFCIQNHVHAFDLDMTVDDEIRKNYNSTQLIQDTKVNVSSDLPELPNITKSKDSKKVEEEPKKETKVQELEPIKENTVVHNTFIKSGVKISEGTSFDVVNVGKISDWQTKGTKVKFVVKNPIYKKKYTIPSGVVFNGEIIESHQPQITCNGGLVVIRINNMSYDGKTIPLNAYVTRADSKKIFLNNIKGDRTYLKTMWQKGNWGRTLFNKMLNLTINLGGEGATLVLSPFPIAYGTICLGANAITSPICAFFSKGGHVSIDAGSNFRIKLLEDAYIN